MHAALVQIAADCKKLVGKTVGGLESILHLRRRRGLRQLGCPWAGPLQSATDPGTARPARKGGEARESVALVGYGPSGDAQCAS
eukprot:377422-Pyramimonas_sp.AAC.1